MPMRDIRCVRFSGRIDLLRKKYASPKAEASVSAFGTGASSLLTSLLPMFTL